VFDESSGGAGEKLVDAFDALLDLVIQGADDEPVLLIERPVNCRIPTENLPVGTGSYPLKM
jgi:hypothetical protein